MTQDTPAFFTLDHGTVSTTAALIAPGVFAIHGEGEKPIFETGAADSGMGLEALAEDGDPSGLADAISALVPQFEGAFELGQAVRSVLRDAQTFRPEIISRFDQVYVFKPLEGIVNAEIAALKIVKAAQEYGVEIEHIDAELVYQIMERGDAAQDTRELTRIVDATLGDLLLQWGLKLGVARLAAGIGIVSLLRVAGERWWGPALVGFVLGFLPGVF